MSLILGKSGWEAFTPKCSCQGHRDKVNLVTRGARGIEQDVYLNMEDFLAAALYFLSNTDLLKDDPRVEFVKIVKKLEVLPGRNKGKKMLRERGIRP